MTEFFPAPQHRSGLVALLVSKVNTFWVNDVVSTVRMPSRV